MLELTPMPVQSSFRINYGETEDEFLASLGLDQAETFIENLPPAECPTTHHFLPGWYIREITMPAGTILTSKIHKTEHPYHVSKGEVSVWTQNQGTIRIRSPHSGITQPNTRRLIYVWEECVWTTFHKNDNGWTTPDDVEKDIIQPHINPLLKFQYADAHNQLPERTMNILEGGSR
jgi:hypothetical protein